MSDNMNDNGNTGDVLKELAELKQQVTELQKLILELGDALGFDLTENRSR
jgi:hypothetical protein